MKTRSYVNAISSKCPDIPIESIREISTGQNNDVLVVNEQLIFRFPKHAEAARNLAQECRILQHLRTRMHVRIPQPEYVSLSASDNTLFIGYEMIEGIPLSDDIFHSTKDKQKLADELGSFLKTLHGVEAGSALDMEAPDHVAFWTDLYDRIQNKLFSYMNSEARLNVKNHFESVLKNYGFFNVPSVLIHGDFGTSNILIHPETGALAGVIDFGDSGLGDPALDFAALYAQYGEGFLEMCKASYGGMERIQERLDFYAGTFALQEALFGIENDDKAAFENGIRTYI
ncbi:aminoglycoside phosphotransferase family protein [Paenibacillus profundus]|uniref:Aminoglycoside phosphotransferase family protein n=1 Tax=Paenibacillus profundus TaxID=1173085 RepID=A0ABS8YML7_9BACL|nr:aminoglycoside phosphotransferase family protein [Paenibacillus profundus]MCE5170829.1 aminoglycoside phosphotransferase family protein [Paenibacillus profundus]